MCPSHVNRNREIHTQKSVPARDISDVPAKHKLLWL